MSNENLSIIFVVTAKVNDVRVSSRDANSFVRDVRSWFRSSLGHECYVEGCTFEEVAETISNKQRAVRLLILR